MLTSNNPTPLPYAPYRTPHSSSHTHDSQYPQNSTIALPNNLSISPLLNQEHPHVLTLTVPHTSPDEGSVKLTFQHQNGVDAREHPTRKMLSMPQSYHKEGSRRKKLTIGGESCPQEHQTKWNGEGFNTSRSIPLERSLSKLRSNYLEANILQEEEQLKRIEEKALQLRQKQKMNRQIIKKFIKEGTNNYQNLPYSLSAIPIKSKFAHRRVQSCNFPIPEEKHSPDMMRSLDRVNSQQEEDEAEMSSVLGKSNELVAVFNDPPSSLLSLQEQLSLERKMKEKLIEDYECQKRQLQVQISKAVQQCRKSQQIISELEKEKVKIEEQRIKQIEQLSYRYNQQISAKERQIAQFALTISLQTIKLQQIQQKYEVLLTKQQANSQRLQNIDKQNKAKNQEYSQSKRKLEKELGQLAEDRRKSQQLYLREIQALKQKIEAQSADQVLLASQLNRKSNETIKKKQQQLVIANRQKNVLENSIKIHQHQIANLKETVSKLTLSNQQKEQARAILQEYLINAEDHIRKVQVKYHQTSRQLTEKNLAYDFLWIQLQALQKPTTEEKQKQADSHVSLMHSSENDSPMKQEERGLNHILSSSTIKDINELRGIMEEGETSTKQKRNSYGQQVRVNLPITHRPSLNLPLLVDSQCSADDAVLEEIVRSENKKQGNRNILLKSQLSEAFSQQNDDIDDMLSNKNSNTSKMESSVGAFSEYSRAKSTQSALSHKQVEQEYQNKIKNSKMMAKLGKFKPKK